MSTLPALIFRMPRILYVTAALFFVASFGLTLAEINMTLAYAERGDPAVQLAMLRGLYQAVLEAVYIAVNGVLVQLLIAIWENGSVTRDRGGDA